MDPVLSLQVPTPGQFAVRRGWLSDPDMMSYNAGWSLTHPGYDPVTGCIDWPESQWPDFAARLALPVSVHGYYYVQDIATGEFIGHVHYLVDDARVAGIGFNVVPARRGGGLGRAFLRLLLERVWQDTAAVVAVNEFEDEREPAVRTHRACGFAPNENTARRYGRETRTWRLPRPEAGTTGQGARR